MKKILSVLALFAFVVTGSFALSNELQVTYSNPIETYSDTSSITFFGQTT